MKKKFSLSVLFLSLAFVNQEVTATATCSLCAQWNIPQKPFLIYGKTYYVGVRGLSAVLIRTSEGLVLLDGGLADSAKLIEENIRTLGFDVADIKLILNSHAHFDHAGGIAKLQRDSHARVAASAAGAKALENGKLMPDDPQFGFGPSGTGFPRVSHVKVVQDSQVLKLGDTEITAHVTPGHTWGSTSWTWRSCEAQTCLNIVYADSLNAVSAPGYRFLTGKGSDNRTTAEALRRSIKRVRELPCDVLLTVHPDISRTFEKLEQREVDTSVNPFVDSNACRNYADNAERQLEQRLMEERKAMKSN